MPIKLPDLLATKLKKEVVTSPITATLVPVPTETTPAVPTVTVPAVPIPTVPAVPTTQVPLRLTLSYLFSQGHILCAVLHGQSFSIHINIYIRAANPIGSPPLSSHVMSHMDRLHLPSWIHSMHTSKHLASGGYARKVSGSGVATLWCRGERHVHRVRFLGR